MNACWTVFAFVLVVSLVVLRQTESSCVKAKLCCQGKNVSCIVPGKRIKPLRIGGGGDGGAEGEGEEIGNCFCDAGCIDIGDCCTDYRVQCPPVDCVVADKWHDWEGCDASCGLGMRQRVRKILQEPLNGGKPCTKTVQRAVCEGAKCKVPRASGTVEEIREIGKILPAAFAGWRTNKKYNPYEDIRKNIFLNMQESPILRDRPSYCATYELTEVRPGCQLQPEEHPWTVNFTKGASICVECQYMAMQTKLGGRCNGHGVYQRETRWTAVGVTGCHGTWFMQSRRKDCECTEEGSSFILV